MVYRWGVGSLRAISTRAARDRGPFARAYREDKLKAGGPRLKAKVRHHPISQGETLPPIDEERAAGRGVESEGRG